MSSKLLENSWNLLRKCVFPLSSLQHIGLQELPFRSRGKTYGRAFPLRAVWASAWEERGRSGVLRDWLPTSARGGVVPWSLCGARALGSFSPRQSQGEAACSVLAFSAGARLPWETAEPPCLTSTCGGGSGCHAAARQKTSIHLKRDSLTVLGIKQRAGVAPTPPHLKQGTELPEHEKVKQKLKGAEQSVHLPPVREHTRACLLKPAGPISQAGGDGSGLSSLSRSAARLAANAVTAAQGPKAQCGRASAAPPPAPEKRAWVLQDGKGETSLAPLALFTSRNKAFPNLAFCF